MKIDPYNTEKRYLTWKEKAISGLNEISPTNKEILFKYLNDMEIGINVYRGAKKGPRSFIHLNSSKDRLISMMKKIKDLYKLDDITKINEQQIHLLFANMRNGKKYMYVRDFVKVFKAFWH